MIEIKFFAELSGVQFLTRNEVLFRLRCRRWPLQNVKDQPSMVVEQQHPEVAERVVVPECVAIIKESKVPRDEKILLPGNQGMANRGAARTIDAARAAVGKDL